MGINIQKMTPTDFYYSIVTQIFTEEYLKKNSQTKAIQDYFEVGSGIKVEKMEYYYISYLTYWNASVMFNPTANKVVNVESQVLTNKEALEYILDYKKGI